MGYARWHTVCSYVKSHFQSEAIKRLRANLDFMSTMWLAISRSTYDELFQNPLVIFREPHSKLLTYYLRNVTRTLARIESDRDVAVSHGRALAGRLARRRMTAIFFARDHADFDCLRASDVWRCWRCAQLVRDVRECCAVAGRTSAAAPSRGEGSVYLNAK